VSYVVAMTPDSIARMIRANVRYIRTHANLRYSTIFCVTENNSAQVEAIRVDEIIRGEQRESKYAIDGSKLETYYGKPNVCGHTTDNNWKATYGNMLGFWGKTGNLRFCKEMFCYTDDPKFQTTKFDSEEAKKLILKQASNYSQIITTSVDPNKLTETTVTYNGKNHGSANDDLISALLMSYSVFRATKSKNSLTN